MSDEEILTAYCKNQYSESFATGEIREKIKNTLGFQSYLLRFRAGEVMDEVIKEVNKYLPSFLKLKR